MTKELIYIAVSIANGCPYCIHSHTAAARAKGLTPEQHGEFLAVVGMANQTNALVNGHADCTSMSPSSSGWKDR